MPGAPCMGNSASAPKGPWAVQQVLALPADGGRSSWRDDAIDVGLAGAAADELDRCPSARSLAAAGGRA